MTTAIIDYESGNLHSAEKAFQRMALETGSGGPVVVTSDPDLVRRADRVVLPGVGAFADCRAGLHAVDGMAEALAEKAIKGGAPFLGICVGMQLMASIGRENGAHQGFGWIPGEVVRIMPSDPALKIPHMGWNDLTEVAAHPVFEGIGPGDHAYFVHSYHLETEIDAHRLAAVDYGQRVTAAAGRDNLIGVQFHPEKSQATGLKLIGNFLRWAP